MSAFQNRALRFQLAGFVLLYVYAGVSLCLFPGRLNVSPDAPLFTLWAYEGYTYGTGPLDLSIISPVQGLGGLTPPFAYWMHPGFLPGFLAPDPKIAAIANYAVIILAYTVATYCLGRALGLSSCAALLGAQLAGIFFFPPMWPWLYPLRLHGCQALELSPALALPVILGCLITAAFYKLGTGTRRTNLACLLAMPLLAVYSYVCDPLYTAVYMICPVFFIGTAFLCSPGRRAFRWRLAGLAVSAFVCVLARMPSCYRAYSRYSDRTVFPNEIYQLVQDIGHGTAWIFEGPSATVGALAVIAASAYLVARGSRTEKVVGCAVLAFQAFVIGLSLLYVYAGIRWSYPCPEYFEHSAYPGYLVAFILALTRWFRGPAHASSPNPAKVHRRVAHGFEANRGIVITALPAIATMCVTALWVSGVRAPMAEPLGNGPIVEKLSQDLGMAPGRPFRGSVVIKTAGVPGGPLARALGIADDAPFSFDTDLAVHWYKRRACEGNLAIPQIWNQHIPTLEHNSQLISPIRYLVYSRLLARPIDYHMANIRTVTLVRPNLMAAMGARYVLSDRNLYESHSLALALATKSSHGIPMNLYEIPNPNTGHYSPTTVTIVASADEGIRQMGSDTFSFEDQVLLGPHAPPLPGLVRASHGEMVFERGGVRVSGKSPGTSLLMLPLEFSNALRLDSTSHPTPKLLRANLLLTAVLFTGDLDAKISHVFGPLRDLRGRLQDIDDMKSLGIREDPHRPYPPDQMPRALRER